MSKSREAFRTISEVADWLETPAHVLRFWESKFTQVKPVKRAGGRRYYRPADMMLLGGIKKLLHDDGLTIKGAQKLLREHGVKHVASLSQPLEEDVIEEAGFIDVPEAPPEPKEPAQVLNFRPRDEAEDTAEDTIAAPDPSPSEAQQPDAPQSQPDSEDAAASSADAPAFTEQTAAPKENAAPEPDMASEARVVDVRKTEAPSTDAADEPPTPVAHPATPVADPVTPDVAATDDPPPAGFGDETLPAFMRRGSNPEAEDAAPEPEAASPAPAPAPKVTIDPVAQFVHASAAPEPAEINTVPDSPADASPQFDAEDDAPAPTPPATDTATRPVLMADVPPAAKIAPEIDSYPDDGGVLSALAGASGLSADLANELTPHLAELRALRDRMVNAGHT